MGVERPSTASTASYFRLTGYRGCRNKPTGEAPVVKREKAVAVRRSRPFKGRCLQQKKCAEAEGHDSRFTVGLSPDFERDYSAEKKKKMEGFIPCTSTLIPDVGFQSSQGKDQS